MFKFIQKKTIIGFITLLTLFSFTQKCNLNEFRLLEGTWKMENKENYETWKIKNENELEGSSYKMKADKKIVSEFLSIKKIEGKVIYTAQVVNQNDGKPIEFVLNKEVKNKISFENLTHDFPKKIQYTKLDETTLFVEVLGENDKGFSYKMMKQK
ncbi:DUF6265 family protein [Flavobacterium aquatile]|uniref:DUF6265 family protein n=1 Tax=Flavobacterium aquatile TaxID=245 RepID=UPI0027D9522C|nr:DUF6265 family protein [Flavobacterium aquatile]